MSKTGKAEGKEWEGNAIAPRPSCGEAGAGAGVEAQDRAMDVSRTGHWAASYMKRVYYCFVIGKCIERKDVIRWK